MPHPYLSLNSKHLGENQVFAKWVSGGGKPRRGPSGEGLSLTLLRECVFPGIDARLSGRLCVATAE